MKNMRFITGMAVSAIIVWVLIFNSCSKQELKEQTAARKQEVQMSDEDVAVYNKIMTFKKKVDYIKENPNYKSGETITVDSAVWYLDAALNFTYSFVFESFTGFYTDSVFVEVPINGGMVNLDDVSAAYFEMYDKLYEIYVTVPGENKDLYISTTEIKDITTTTVTFKSTATFGERGTPLEEQPFVEGDNWMWGELAGLCPGTEDEEEDAATKIADATMFYRYLYIQDIGNGWHAYYTDPSHTVTAVADYDLWREENPFDNYHDYLMFYAHKDNCPEGTIIEDFMCIEWEDMNWYYFGMNEIIYSIIPYHTEVWPEVPGKYFTDINMEGGKTHATNYPFEIINLYHRAYITYRTRWIVADDDYPLPF